MPYADLDLSVQDKYRTVWVVLPNTYFDPEKGHALYNRYLDELELAAELGFDGVCGQRASPERLWPDAVADRDGGGAGAAHQGLPRSRSSATRSACASIR